MPLYPLYALLFADAGLSNTEISALFAIWSIAGVLAEVPAGALADRFSRRNTLVAAGVLQGVGYLLWMVWPGFPGFAAGFVLWGLGGALVSGALEALLYDGLAAVGAEASFAGVLGRVTAAGLTAQLPAAGAATVLFRLGGYPLVGWASVACCVLTAALASRLPEPPRGDGADEPESYLGTLRAGLREAAARPIVRGAVLTVAVLTGLDALEEYFPLLANDWGVPTALVPLSLLAIPLAGAVGAGMASRAERWGSVRLGFLLGAAAFLLGLAGLLGRPVGLVGIALFYGLYRLALVVLNARLQDRIGAASRATVTSVAALGSEITALVLYALWALGGVVPVAVLLSVVAVALPRLVRAPVTRPANPVGGVASDQGV